MRYSFFTPHYVQINSIVQERHSKVSFNVSWLEDLYEETVVEVSGEKVTPLMSNPGRIMLTSSRIYFQPYNNVEVVCDLPVIIVTLIVCM